MNFHNPVNIIPFVCSQINGISQKKVMKINLHNQNQSYHPGDIVFIFYRNPHTQDVANIQQAAVVTES